MKIPAQYRKAVYIAAVLIAALAFGAGVVTPTEVNAGIDTAQQVVALAAGILALVNLTPDE